MAPADDNERTKDGRPLHDEAKLRHVGNAEWLGQILQSAPSDVTAEELERPWVWAAPDDGPALVGWGEQARFEASGDAPMTHAWQDFAQWAGEGRDRLPAFGSFPFDPAQPGFLVVPRVLVMRERPGAATRVFPADAADPRPADFAVASELHVNFTLPRGSREHWTEAVDATRAVLSEPVGSDTGEVMQKVVLARRVHARADRALDQRRILATLAARFTDCWTFSHDGLVGATPELLAEVHDGVFHCRILAGTRKPKWDEELLTDPKERREHELSVTSVTTHLAQAGLLDAQVTGPFLLRLPNVTHLATDIRATVRPGHGSADISDLLYPTAAICGAPRDLAFAQIQRVEGLDRGRFSGPVGWLRPDGSGQWALALRCAQFDDGSRNADLFAGAGILPDSDAGREWLETDAKMEPMRRALSAG
ncbi:chorismate-binding protein [Propionibacterium freudenreichii]|uniref:Isochorismate synthetase (Enterochelin biosynthesis) n=1 Tax=Propionibacterium freudenreichii subsp. shermanii (strain ATCC 9614 / DSM 4902 / CIP 103027 / NCIMB 8099 / CIRM-BIA1) TaxID=754252 RepID=D7GCM2_PROFC|nr:chorismate-binding protein [Propionibacterium freudenreichii]MCQ1997031.1 chorismate-binding protein [Propionibacterium freudenreichii]MDK9297045.1 chorismate-binding protein [Propionibacterium freudenreichii]MDK9350898.1 chorismate-binding protein [Propionibacterium freudenreichii]MDK9640910.1 chorismate-binding protein [Propionibacterium freudenreichii]WBF60430.1 chorismate-binding protein [Propionibacterium freudenreichii]